MNIQILQMMRDYLESGNKFIKQDLDEILTPEEFQEYKNIVELRIEDL